VADTALDESLQLHTACGAPLTIMLPAQALRDMRRSSPLCAADATSRGELMLHSGISQNGRMFLLRARADLGLLDRDESVALSAARRIIDVAAKGERDPERLKAVTLAFNPPALPHRAHEALDVAGRTSPSVRSAATSTFTLAFEMRLLRSKKPLLRKKSYNFSTSSAFSPDAATVSLAPTGVVVEPRHAFGVRRHRLRGRCRRASRARPWQRSRPKS
jgi:hypothetical protein